MRCIDKLNVGEFFAAPRHAYFFSVDKRTQCKIAQRWSELRTSGAMIGKKPIINIQEDPDIVELHDGNASAVAWLLYAEERGIAPLLGEFKKSFDGVIVLRNRMNENGEVWHPFVPPEVACAGRLQRVSDAEQHGREVRKAITQSGAPIYFDNTEFFSGNDSAERIGAIVERCAKRPRSNDSH